MNGGSDVTCRGTPGCALVPRWPIVRNRRRRLHLATAGAVPVAAWTRRLAGSSVARHLPESCPSHAIIV